MKKNVFLVFLTSMVLLACQKQKDDTIAAPKNPTLKKNLAYPSRTLTATGTELQFCELEFYTGKGQDNVFTEVELNYDSCSLPLDKVSNMHLDLIMESDVNQHFTASDPGVIQYSSLYGVPILPDTKYRLKGFCTVAAGAVGKFQVGVTIPYYWGDGYNNFLKEVGQEMKFRPAYRTTIDVKRIQTSSTLIDSSAHDGIILEVKNTGTAEGAVKQFPIGFGFVRNAASSGTFNLYDLKVFWDGQDTTGNMSFVNAAGDTIRTISEADTVLYLVAKKEFHLQAGETKKLIFRCKGANFGSGNQNGYRTWIIPDRSPAGYTQRYINRGNPQKFRLSLSDITMPDQNAFPSGFLWCDGSGGAINSTPGFSSYNWYNSYYLIVDESKQDHIN